MDRFPPIVMSLDCVLRFLASDGDGDEGLRIVLKADDDPYDWELPRVPREGVELASCRVQKQTLVANIREGAARASIAISLNNLAALYIFEERYTEASSALHEADQWFAEMPVYHPPSGKYDLVGRAVVAYNASVLAGCEGNPGSTERHLEMASMFLEALPESDRDEQSDFVRAAMTGTP